MHTISAIGPARFCYPKRGGGGGGGGRRVGGGWRVGSGDIAG